VIGPLLTLMAASAGEEPVPWSEAARMSVHVIYREHVLTLDYSIDPGRWAACLAGLAGDFFSPFAAAVAAFRGHLCQ
jgi:hypothetical protein